MLLATQPLARVIRGPRQLPLRPALFRFPRPSEHRPGAHAADTGREDLENEVGASRGQYNGCRIA
jgi:hypothetical protein